MTVFIVSGTRLALEPAFRLIGSSGVQAQPMVRARADRSQYRCFPFSAFRIAQDAGSRPTAHVVQYWRPSHDAIVFQHDAGAEEIVGDANDRGVWLWHWRCGLCRSETQAAGCQGGSAGGGAGGLGGCGGLGLGGIVVLLFSGTTVAVFLGSSSRRT